MAVATPKQTRRTLGEARRRLGFARADIAVMMSVSPDTVRRLELGKGTRGHAKFYARVLRELCTLVNKPEWLADEQLIPGEA